MQFSSRCVLIVMHPHFCQLPAPAWLYWSKFSSVQITNTRTWHAVMYGQDFSHYNTVVSVRRDVNMS